MTGIGCGWVGVFSVVVKGVKTVAIRRPQCPITGLLQLLLHKRIVIVGGGGKFTAKGGFWIVLPQREIPLLLVMHH